eukprot:m51a1_g3543 putative protein (454) ;mRNA; f:986797-988607
MAAFFVFFGVLVAVCAATAWSAHRAAASATSEPAVVTPAFTRFQRNYLLVYLIATGADWIQGPYVYMLYEYYGYKREEIARFFIVGFGSSMLFGTFVGSVADKYGRKRLAMAYGVLYAAGCLCKTVNNTPVLVLARVFTGIATSLLFSVFESWMVHEHHRNGFPDSNLSQTFSYACFSNGVVAIAAGILASFLADEWGMGLGFVSPFLAAAVALLTLSAIVHQTWVENYGEASAAVSNVFTNALEDLRRDRHVLLICVVQSLFEGAMYSFVFIWTPSLRGAAGCELPPLGWVFAAYMVAIMIGSQCFTLAQRVLGKSVEQIAVVNFALSAGAMLLASYFISARGDDCSTTATAVVLLCFTLFEGSCGVYFPSMGTLKGKYLPERSRSTLMNFARVGLNLMLVLLLFNVAGMSNAFVVGLCGVSLGSAAVLQTLFNRLPANPPATTLPVTNPEA